MENYIIFFVLAGVIVIALIIYWIIEVAIAKKIKLKAIDELDKKLQEEETNNENKDYDKIEEQPEQPEPDKLPNEKE